MSDDALRALAESAGVAVSWQDVHGQTHAVGADTLRAVLRAIDLPASTDAEIDDSRHRLQESARQLAPLVTAAPGERVAVAGRWEATLEDGTERSGSDIVAIEYPGYHRLRTARGEITLVVAPLHCHPVPQGRSWGIGVQLYALRRMRGGGIGDFAALAEFARAAAAQGADAVAISPVHALFAANSARISPYAPSSRVMLNVLHVPVDEAGPGDDALIDWTRESGARLARLRADYAGDRESRGFADFRAQRGAMLEDHARFEALHAHRRELDATVGWRQWPEELRSPKSPQVAEFARAHADEVGFHAWLQFRADAALAGAQQAARQSGMRIGLIADLAVGTDADGSHTWSRRDETLPGMTVGAPPDLLNTKGQNWGLATFSPRGLHAHGFGAFIEMLEAALRHAGGLRIDHAMGLQRLWVIPDGATPDQGTYLRYPVQDLLRLVALESQRHRAVVLAEDLGTVPADFGERLSQAGVLGMRVLWFERDAAGFRPPAQWTRGAVAMTSTHDLATVAGWWRGEDIAWRARIGLVPDVPAAQQERAAERAQLWQAFRASGATSAELPPVDSPAPVATAACAHVAGAASDLAILQMEDVLASPDQPNLPGTIGEHPNWRRRLPTNSASLLARPDVAERLGAIRTARKHPLESG